MKSLKGECVQMEGITTIKTVYYLLVLWKQRKLLVVASLLEII